jgi:hypothetical protein
MSLTGPGRPEKTAGRSGCRITNETTAAHADVISAIDSSLLPFLPDGPGDTATPARSAITATSASCPTAAKASRGPGVADAALAPAAVSVPRYPSASPAG